VRIESFANTYKYNLEHNKTLAENNLSQKLALSFRELPVYEGYEITRRIGVGAGSVIYAVKDRRDGQLFALKHVVRHDGQDKRLIEQVENEYRMANRVNHPYIRNIHEIKRIKRRLHTREVFMLMEFCPGIGLDQSSSRSLLDLLLIFRMVADGLTGMHNAGLLHCDMKPNNIIIAENGSIRIIDLGQSCPIGTVKARIQGTPDYIAPEQVRRKPLSRQTDIFNLGATMYWAFAGKHIPTVLPKGGNRLELADEATSGTPPTPHQLKPKIPIGVSNLIMECVNKLPQDRPPDMPSLISRLDLLIHMVAGGKPVASSEL